VSLFYSFLEPVPLGECHTPTYVPTIAGEIMVFSAASELVARDSGPFIAQGAAGEDFM